MNNVNNNAQMALFLTNQWLLTLEAEKLEALQVTSKSCKQCTAQRRCHLKSLRTDLETRQTHN